MVASVTKRHAAASFAAVESHARILGAMVLVQVVETIAAPSDKILEFVMDIERYADVDAKIKPILWARRDGNRLEFACRPKLVGIRQPKVIQFAELTPGRRIEIGLLPLPCNRLAHATSRRVSSASPRVTERGSPAPWNSHSIPQSAG
jgi:hypothetical protein